MTGIDPKRALTKLKTMKAIIYITLVFFTSSVSASWKAPENPDPRKILTEAREDADSGKYDEALAKHIWFHKNVLNIDERYYGVRLSFALSDWIDLGEKYPAARQALISIRDETGKRIRDNNDIYRDFNDYESINERLNDSKKTVELFKWLDENQQNKAKKVYALSENSLFNNKEFKLCGKYIEPMNVFLRHVRNLKELIQYDRGDMGYKFFDEKVSILITILVQNNRMNEARDIADQAILEWDNEEFKIKLDKILKGKIIRTRF